jgi:hypothetical protein
MTNRSAEKDGSKISVRSLVILAIAWGIVVCGFLVWQAFMYQGIFAALAEWQFRTWDRMFPVATIALLTLLLELPLLIAIALKLHRRRRSYGKAKAGPLSVLDKQTARLFALLAGLSLVLALGLALMGLTIGAFGDKPSATLALDGDGIQTGGIVRTRGLVRTDRIGYYRERFVVTGRDLWVAPIMLSETDRTIRAFAEVRPAREASEAQIMEISGVARRAALPGGLRRLYEYEGYTVAQPAYVIFSSRASARWPFFSAAADLAIAALLFLLTFAAFRAHARRMERKGASHSVDERSGEA